MSENKETKERKGPLKGCLIVPVVGLSVMGCLGIIGWWESGHVTISSNAGGQTVKAEPVIDVSGEEVAAADRHLLRCGLSEARRFSDREAWIGSNINQGDVEREQATLDNLAAWALLQEPKLKSAYLLALKSHQDGINEAREEFLHHALRDRQAAYRKDQSAREAKTAELEASMAGPCHSTGKLPKP